MPRRVTDVCLEILESIKQAEGNIEVIPMKWLESKILRLAGGDARTRKLYRKYMLELNLLTPIDNATFKVNWDEAERLML